MTHGDIKRHIKNNDMDVLIEYITNNDLSKEQVKTLAGQIPAEEEGDVVFKTLQDKYTTLIDRLRYSFVDTEKGEKLLLYYIGEQ